MTLEVMLTDKRVIESSLDILQQEVPWAVFHAAPSEEEALALADRIHVLCGWPGEKLLKAAGNLKWLHVGAAGVNTLPLAELNRRGIITTNARGMHGDTIADHVMALILAWSRKLPLRLQRQREGLWDRGGDARELAGTTLGVIGLGGIGRKVAWRARAFGMTVLGTRRSGADVPEADAVYPTDQMLEMLPRCEFLAVCCPLTAQTEGLLGREALRALPRGAFIVNIARGPVIDEEELIEALREGHLGGAGLDVFAEEPLAEDSPLWAMENVIVTPHVAGQQSRSGEKVARRLIENLKRWHREEPLMWVVDYDEGY